MSEKIQLPGKMLKHLRSDQYPTIRLSSRAYNLLTDVTNETSLSISKVASMIIIQAIEKDLIEIERTNDESERIN